MFRDIPDRNGGEPLPCHNTACTRPGEVSVDFGHIQPESTGTYCQVCAPVMLSIARAAKCLARGVAL